MVLIVRQFNDGMRPCVRFDDRVCLGWFAVEQSLHQGYVLAPLLFNIFLTVFMNVAYTRFKAGKDIMNAFGAPEKENGGGEAGGNNRWRVSSGDIAFGHALR